MLLNPGISVHGGRYGFTKVDGLTCTATSTAAADAAAMEYEILLFALL